MSFHDPSVWWLLGLALVPLAWWRWMRPRRRGAIAFSSLDPALRAGRGWVARTRWLPAVLRTAGLVLLVVALARPRQADEQTRIFTEGIAIELVVDRSGSMNTQDFRVGGRPASRLEVVRLVVEQFIRGGEGLPGRPDDLIGLIAFATYPDSRCPLTLDHDHLIDTVRSVEPADTQAESQTAIGDAVALGVERLHGLESRASLASLRTIKSKVLVLLTDGENNAGDIDPMTAAHMAQALGIRIYTIGAGSEVTARDLFRDPFQQQAGIDEKTLKAIAEATGGQYFRATDTASLEAIYRRIDELERTEIEQRRYLQHTELALQSVRWGPFPIPPLLAAAFVLLALEVVLIRTRYAVLP